MRLPRLQLTVKRMMVVVATLAVSWSAFVGIAHLAIYPRNVHFERTLREQALVWEAKHEAEKAAGLRQMAEECGRRNAESLAYIITALGLVGLGTATGALGLAFKGHYGKQNLVQPDWL